MQVLQSHSESERKALLRQAIFRRAPGIPSEQLDFICESVNTNRNYFIKVAFNIERYLNLVTRETIVTDNIRIFSEIIPIYGNFKSPYFEKIGETRIIKKGELDSVHPAAAIKIRAGIENLRSSVTYSLILFQPE